jgi:glycosyltransferase involved in cell wall biosynthesis
MKRFSSIPRIAFVDLTFNWPPVGGCWIDTHHVIEGLQARGAEVCLFTPDFQEYYPRGAIREEMPYPVVSIPFNRYTFNWFTVKKRFGHCVNQFEPDLIFITDGYHMKNHLLSALGPERCFLRFYAYEMLCINLHYYRYHENRICSEGFFQNPQECRRCWFRRMPALGRAIQIAVGWPETHPKLHFSQEYLASLAFTKGYRRRLLENFSKLKGAIVYNPFMRGKLASFIENIHIIPSGVDADRFKPVDKENLNNQPIKIFLPGRANDPLKGMDTLILAGRILQRQGLAFEIHYTAAMDCPQREPWLINRGWIGQDALPALYREMDIVVVPSIWIEPFGITALEGMASAIPVAAGKTGGLELTVMDGVTGFHFESGNAEALAEALAKLIRDNCLRKQMGLAGRERVLHHYDWNVILDEYYAPLVEKG